MCDDFRRPCCLCRDIAVAIAMCVTTSGTARSRCDVTLFWRGTPIQPKYKTLTRQNQLDAQLNLSIFRQPLHVSGVSRPIIRSYNRMYTAVGTYCSF
jgi:hypothetical protein